MDEDGERDRNTDFGIGIAECGMEDRGLQIPEFQP
jgi:hypothetical protein